MSLHDDAYRTPTPHECVMSEPEIVDEHGSTKSRCTFTDCSAWEFNGTPETYVQVATEERGRASTPEKPASPSSDSQVTGGGQ